jgi:hypothetical protein
MARTLLPTVLVLLSLACIIAVFTGVMYFAQFVLLVFLVLFATAVVKGLQRTE